MVVYDDDSTVECSRPGCGRRMLFRRAVQAGWRFERDDTIADEDLWYRTVVGDFTCTICQAIEMYGFDALALFDRERAENEGE